MSDTYTPAPPPPVVFATLHEDACRALLAELDALCASHVAECKAHPEDEAYYDSHFFRGVGVGAAKDALVRAMARAAQSAASAAQSASMAVVDLVVETANPRALDATVQMLGAATVLEDGSFTAHSYLQAGGRYFVRCFGGCADFVAACITDQGYAVVVGRQDAARTRAEHFLPAGSRPEDPR